MTDIVKTIHAIKSFDELVPYINETLTRFFGQYRMNENVVSVLEVIGRDYQKELSLKDISKDLFINPVYLGQLIKRETNSTLQNYSTNNELRQPSNSYFRPVIASKIFAMQLVTVMLDISIKCSVNCAEITESLSKTGRNYTIKICIPCTKGAIMFNNNIWRSTMKKETDLSMGLANLVCPHFSYVIVWNLESIA